MFNEKLRNSSVPKHSRTYFDYNYKYMCTEVDPDVLPLFSWGKFGLQNSEFDFTLWVGTGAPTPPATRTSMRRTWWPRWLDPRPGDGFHLTRDNISPSRVPYEEFYLQLCHLHQLVP